MEDLKARERKGVAVGKDKYILFCARFAATANIRARSRELEGKKNSQPRSQGLSSYLPGGRYDERPWERGWKTLCKK